MGRKFRRGMGLLALCLVGYILCPHPAPAASENSALAGADAVVVHKSAYTMELMRKGKIVKTYQIALGGNPVGHKQQEGDRRTPEGRYFLDWRNPHSRFYRSFHISYPNATDRKAAAARGVSAGGDIMLHGTGKFPATAITLAPNWTDGCISVTNSDMDELWTALPPDKPVPITIEP